MNKRLRSLLLFILTISMVFTLVACSTQYTVTFETKGGTAIEAKKVDKGEASWLADCLTTKVGYTFDKWYADSKLTQEFKSTDKVEGDITLYAGWKANTYVVTFDYQGKGSGDLTKSVTFGQAMGELPAPTTDGFTLVGWFTAQEGGDKVDASTIVSVAGATTLYARWSNVTTLEAPSNVTVFENALSWDSVKHAASYDVTIDGSTTNQVGTIALLPYMEIGSAHNFSVVAVLGNIKSVAAAKEYVHQLSTLTVDASNSLLTGDNGRVWFVGNSYSTANYTLTVLEGNAVSKKDDTTVVASNAGFAKVKYVKNADSTTIVRLIKVVDKLTSFEPSLDMQARNQVVNTLNTSDYINKTAQKHIVGAANIFKFVPQSNKPIDYLGLTYVVKENGAIVNDMIEVKEDGIQFKANAVGKTLTITVGQRYSTATTNMATFDFEVVVNDGFNVSTKDQLKQYYEDKTVSSINLQSNVNIVETDVERAPCGHIYNNGYAPGGKGNIFTRLNGVDGVNLKVNGNYYNVDISAVPVFDKKDGNDICECGTNNLKGFAIALTHSAMFVAESKNGQTVEFNNMKMVGNKTQGNLQFPDGNPGNLTDFICGGYFAIQNWNTNLVTNNIVTSRVTYGVFNTYMGANAKIIDCNMYDVFDAAISNYGGSKVEIVNSKFAQSEGALLKIVDVEGEDGIPQSHEPQFIVDKQSTFDNWMTGENAYFQGYGLSSTIPTLKASIQTAIWPFGYSMVKGLEKNISQTGKALVEEVFNFIFLVQAGDPMNASAAERPSGNITFGADYDKQTSEWKGGTTVNRAYNYATTNPIDDPRVQSKSLVFPVGQYSDLAAFGALVGSAPDGSNPGGTGLTGKVVVAAMTYVQNKPALTPEQQQLAQVFMAVNGLTNITAADLTTAKFTNAVTYLAFNTAFSSVLDLNRPQGNIMEICTGMLGAQLSMYVEFTDRATAGLPPDYNPGYIPGK